jgi:hypothetical protein
LRCLPIKGGNFILIHRRDFGFFGENIRAVLRLAKTSRAKSGMGQILIEVGPAKPKMANLDMIQFFLRLVAQPTIGRNGNADFLAIGVRNANVPLPIDGSNTGRKIDSRTHNYSLK